MTTQRPWAVSGAQAKERGYQVSESYELQIYPYSVIIPNCIFIFIDICAPGSYSITGLSPCTLCPANTYQSSQRNTLCMDCPPGTVAPNGSTNCTGKDVATVV